MNNSLYPETRLLLEDPPAKERKETELLLNSLCSKNLLLQYAKTLVPWLSEYNRIEKQNAHGHTSEATELEMMLKPTTTKDVIAEGLALILASKVNLQYYINSLSPRMHDLWREVLLHGYVSEEQAKEILGTKDKIYKNNYSSYFYSSLVWTRPEYKWFSTSRLRSGKKLNYGYRTYDDFITVSNLIRGIFFPLFFPELKPMGRSFEKLPSENYFTVGLETESISAFILFSGLFKQGELPMKKKGIAATDMKRVNKKIGLTEFFPDENNEYLQHLRAYDYMGVLGTYEHLKSAYKSKKALSYHDTLLDLFKNFDKLDSYLPGLLYPHIKGMRQNQTYYGHHANLCHVMMDYLMQQPKDYWTAISDIYLRIAQTASDGRTNIYTALVYNPADEQNTTEMTNLYSQEIVSSDCYTREFGITGLQSFAYMLASLGMAEIAIRDHPFSVPSATYEALSASKPPLDASPFNGADYLRLTPLGRYALGISKEYEPPVIEQEAYFELDPERLIVRSLKDPNPYEQLLRDTATPISRGRFQTSALSFLSNCHSRDDVEGKIQIFRQFISSELPPLWQQFFQQLLQHCHPLTEDNTSYRHYTLQPDNRDLIQLITTDPTLRQLVVRAEGYRLLVRAEDIRKFEIQLKKHGYLL